MDNRGSLTPYATSPAGMYPMPASPPPLSPGDYPSWKGMVSYLGDNQLLKFRWLVNPRSSIEDYQRVGCLADGNCLFHAILKALYPLYKRSYMKTQQIKESDLREYERGLHPDAVKHITRGHTVFTGEPYGLSQRSTNPDDVYTIYQPHTYQNQMDSWRRAYVISFRWDFAQKVIRDGQIQGLVFTYLSGMVDMYTDTYQSQGHSPGSARKEGQSAVLRKMYTELISLSDVPADYLLVLAEYAGVDFYLLRYADLYQDVYSPLYGGDSLHRSVRGPLDLRKDQNTSSQRSAIIILSVNNNHYELIGKSTGKGNDLIFRFSPEEPLVRRLYSILDNLRHGFTVSQAIHS